MLPMPANFNLAKLDNCCIVILPLQSKVIVVFIIRNSMFQNEMTTPQ